MDQSAEKLVAELLAEIAKAMRVGDAARLSAIHALVFPKSGKVRSTRTTKGARQSSLALNEVEAFSDFPSREALEEHLRAIYPTKLQIDGVARQLRVATLKTDSFDRLVERVIDATVGYRLRAEAIRGRSEKAKLP